MSARPYFRDYCLWKQGFSISLLTFAVASCFIVSSGCWAADVAKSTQWKVPYQPLGFAWQNLSPKTGPIKSVGGSRLPIPFTLPPGLTPLEGKAQRILLPPGSHWIAFTLFFPAGQNARLRAWLGNLPHEMPLNVRQYHIKTPPQVVEDHLIGRPVYWHIHFAVQATAGKSDVRVVLDSLNDPPGSNQASGPLTNDFGDRIMKSLMAPESPVRGPAAFEQVVIKYAFPNN